MKEIIADFKSKMIALTGVDEPVVSIELSGEIYNKFFSSTIDEVRYLRNVKKKDIGHFVFNGIKILKAAK